MDTNKIFVVVQKNKVYYFSSEGEANFYYNMLPLWEQRESKQFYLDLHETLDAYILKKLKE